jgi:hypothetical protein
MRVPQTEACSRILHQQIVLRKRPLINYSNFIVDKIKSMGESQTIVIGEKAKPLKRQGVDVISFAMGEPDFDTPDKIKEKAIESIWAGHTK